MSPSIREVNEQKALAETASEAINVQRHWTSIDQFEPTSAQNYRPLSVFGNTQKVQHTDIPIMVQSRMQEVCLYMYQSNPLARRHVNMTRDFIVGDGVKIQAEDPRVDEYLQAFWQHPSNNMAKRVSDMSIDLSVYGEYLCTFQFAANDLMLVNYVSPGFIESVETDKSDLSRPIRVMLRVRNNPITSFNALSGVYVEGNPEIDLLSVDGSTGLRTGEGLFLAVNKATDASRGLSDLLPMVDPLSNLETFMFNSIERARHMLQWFWDILYEGSTPEQQRTYFRQIVSEGSAPGTLRIHNEKVKWDSASPDLQSAEIERLFNGLFSYVVTALGMPPHWTGMGGSQGSGARAGAESAAEPAYRSLLNRQGDIRAFLREVVNYQIDHLIKRRKLPKKINRNFTLVMPRITIRDFQRTGGAAMKVVEKIIDAMEKGLYSREEARNLIDPIIEGILKETE